MKMLSVQVDDKLAQAIDDSIKANGLYSSRSEFLKDAIRNNLREIALMSDSLLKTRAGVRELARKAAEMGWDGSDLTQKERIDVAHAYLKKTATIQSPSASKHESIRVRARNP